MSIRQERRRVRRAFQAALLAASSPVMMIACSTGAGDAGEDSGAPATRDATLDPVVLPRADAEAGGSAPDAGAVGADAAPNSQKDGALPDGAKPPHVDAGPGGGCYAGSLQLEAGPDADPDADTCLYFYECGLSGTGLTNVGCEILEVVANGQLAPFPGSLCWLPQDAGCEDDALAPGPGGAVTIACTPCIGGGRRPAGLRKWRRGSAPGGVRGYLARMAFEEEASIAAFARMRVELASLGAPAALASAAKRAERDEARHRSAMVKLARARGARDGEIARARVRRSPGRGAAAVAAENAAEGCVRETFGALITRWQSLHAEDVDVRRAFARVALDEAQHAALSWAIARWIEPTLDAAGRRRVDRARARALASLRRRVSIEPSPELVHAAGLPSATNARVLLEVMIHELALTQPESLEPFSRTWSAEAAV